MSKINKSSGQVSRLLLVLAIVILVAGIITYLVIKMAERPPKPAGPATPTVELPVYDKTLGNVRFVFESARNLGNILRAAEAVNTVYATQKDLSTTEKFIEVTIGAQNKGKANIEQGSWDMENIVDKDGREFIPMDAYIVNPWLPITDLCGDLLKPAFNPLPCTKIYEVAKGSTELKIRVKTGQDNTAGSFSAGKVDVFLIDLIVK